MVLPIFVSTGGGGGGGGCGGGGEVKHTHFIFMVANGDISTYIYIYVAFEGYIYVWGTLRMGLYLSVDIVLLVWTCCSRNGQGQIYI